MKHEFIQNALIQKLEDKKGKRFGLFDLHTWFRDKLAYFGVSFSDPCCAQASNLTTVVESLDSSTNPGTINPDVSITLLSTTTATAYTLGAGTNGQEKTIKLKVDGGNATITGVFDGGTTLTLDDAGDAAILKWVDNKWYPVKLFGSIIS